MAVNKMVVEAPPEAVFAVLADPATYGAFVVGSKHVRRFEPNYPELGSCFHHTLGVGPLILRDKTCVEEVEEGRRLVLLAHMRPFAVNRVAFTLHPVPEGTEVPNTEVPNTEVEVEEYAVEGPVAAVWNPVLEAAMGLRNQEMLRRLKRIAERRLARRREVAGL
ncbi:MAG TPA: SRPBCC family protein [Acidimicrobiales bacterium]|nr:SRPBCC family protein [Acidimicrobiales bacterium]